MQILITSLWLPHTLTVLYCVCTDSDYLPLASSHSSYCITLSVCTDSDYLPWHPHTLLIVLDTFLFQSKVLWTEG